jgi:hypothetical protein
MLSIRAKTWVLTGILTVAVVSTTSGRIITVDDDGPADFNNIQAAINDANENDVVEVRPGRYTGEGNRDINFLGKAITVRSIDPNDPNIVSDTIVDCNASEEDPHRGFLFGTGENGRSELSGLTVTRGYAANGGGVTCSKSSPIISNCTFVENSAKRGGGCYNSMNHATLINCVFYKNSATLKGGGMHNYGGTPIVRHCMFIDNLVIEWGGAMYNKETRAEVTNSTFTGNQAEHGGGMFNYDAEPRLEGCSFVSNSAASSGGAVWNSMGAQPTMLRCVFRANSAVGGGAIWNSSRAAPVLIGCVLQGNLANLGGGLCNADGRPTVTNCLFTGNRAHEGGAICVRYESILELTNCTITGNFATQGTAVACYTWYGMYPNYVRISNSIIWDDGVEIALCDDSTIAVAYSNVRGGWAGEGNVNTDPCFLVAGYWVDGNDPNIVVEPNDPNAVWVEGDYRLLAISPCIDAGDPNYVPAPNETDLDGNPRVVDGDNDGNAVVDMGAYEVQFANTPPVAVAGANQTVYAGCGTAEVVLGGNDCYDEDGDELSYYWSWSVDGDVYEANGVNPNIELPVGEHVITLVVNDGTEDSEPNACIITVIGPVQAHVWILPRVINRHSRAKRIMAFMLLPEGITKDQISSDKFVLYPAGIEAVHQMILPRSTKQTKRTVVICFFERDALSAAVPDNGRAQLQLAGRLKDGRYCCGAGTVWIRNSRRPERFLWPWR